MEIPLTCPQLMAADTLRSILKDRCIDLGELHKMDKDKLVELFRRVALPLPQRKYSEEILRKRMQNSRSEGNVRVVDHDENNDVSTTLPVLLLMSEENHSEDCKQNGQLKPAIDERKQINEQIRPNSCEQNDRIHEQHVNKRQNDVPLRMDTRKRQKITWP